MTFESNVLLFRQDMSKDHMEVDDNKDGTVALKYAPKQDGVHEVIIKYNGENIKGNTQIYFAFTVCVWPALQACVH